MVKLVMALIQGGTQCRLVAAEGPYQLGNSSVTQPEIQIQV